jgi:predicted transcriptional regulator of viral defense system
MKNYTVLHEKLLYNKKKIITKEELSDTCKLLKISYESAINYLLTKKYVLRIFRGIFYIKSLEERKLGKLELNFYDVLKEAFKIKGIENWYFGLETAIKFNNLTHEYFTITYVISDKLKRKEVMDIFGYKVKFISIKKELTNFGIIKDNFPYSDTEKTILDKIYLGFYKGLDKVIIRNNIIEYYDECDKKKLINYAKHYPKTVRRFIESLDNDKKRNNLFYNKKEGN